MTPPKIKWYHPVIELQITSGINSVGYTLPQANFYKRKNEISLEHTWLYPYIKNFGHYFAPFNRLLYSDEFGAVISTEHEFWILFNTMTVPHYLYIPTGGGNGTISFKRRLSHLNHCPQETQLLRNFINNNLKIFMVNGQMEVLNSPLVSFLNHHTYIEEKPVQSIPEIEI